MVGRGHGAAAFIAVQCCWSRLTFYLLDLTNERSTTFPAQPAKPFASRLTTYCDEPDEMGLRLNRKGDEDAKSFRKNLDWPHYFCTGGHHFQALRNSSGNPAALWLACPIRSFRWVGGWHAWGRNSFQMGVSRSGCKPLVRLPGCSLAWGRFCQLWRWCGGGLRRAGSNPAAGYESNRSQHYEHQYRLDHRQHSAFR